MNRKSKTTQIREIRHTPTEFATNPKDIADLLNVHFTEIGKKLASEIPEPPSGIGFETYLSKTNTNFRLQEIDPSRVLKLLGTDHYFFGGGGDEKS